MKFAQVVYRLRQFQHAISERPAPEDLALVNQVLNPKQWDLFQGMQLGEQAHSIRVFHRVWNRQGGELNEENRGLFEAALLHDVGKSRFPLAVWERVLIVLGKALFPDLVKRWGAQEESIAGKSSDSLGWRRPFVISEQHARWGAEMAAEAGASHLAVSLILNHQNLFPAEIVSIEDRYLYELQSADQQS